MLQSCSLSKFNEEHLFLTEHVILVSKVLWNFKDTLSEVLFYWSRHSIRQIITANIIAGDQPLNQ